MNCNELDKDSTLEFLEAIKKSSEYIKIFKAREFKESLFNRDSIEIKESKEFKSTVTDCNQNNTYIPVNKDLDMLDDENTSTIVYKIYNSLEIDAGGFYLYDISNECELHLWIRVSQLWGSLLPIELNNDLKENMIQKLKKSIEILAEIFKDNEYIVNPSIVGLCRQSRLLKNGLIKILKCVENFIKGSIDELTVRDDYPSSGHLIPLNCGHSGKYNENERDIVMKHLKKAKFIIDNS